MIQLKVFYNISFPEDRCEIITTKENELTSFEDLMQIVRRKLECLHFIPDEELRIQYKDDEDTFVNLRVGDSFQNALRCAQAVPGATFRRLKVKIQWQPKSTPELISTKRREITERKLGGESKKELLFDGKDCNSSTSILTRMDSHTPGPGECFFTDHEFGSKSPPRKQQRVRSVPVSANSPEGVTPSVHSNEKYKSPLELLIQDKQVEVEKERRNVTELQRELDRLQTVYSKHPGVDYSRPACTICHRREGHNRVNCPYKGHPCLSSQFCGDLNKHKNEKDSVSAAANRLQSAKKCLDKLQNDLAMKSALKVQTTNSFSSVMRTRLVSECRARYLTSQGFENWRQINKDLKKLEAHFKGKIPGNEISLITALDEYNKKIYPAQSEVGLSGNPVRTLWELKGIKWPSTASNSEVSETSTCSVTSSQQTKHLAPATMQEEEEHLKTALIESRMNTVYRPLAVDDSSIITAVDASEKIPLSDAASALMDLSDFGSRQKYYYH